MVLGVGQEVVGRPLRQSNCNQSAQSVPVSHRLGNKFLNLVTIGLALAGAVAIASPALSQTAMLGLSAARSGSDTVVQRSTCVRDPQGLMCNANSNEIDQLPLTPQTSVHTATVLQPLTHVQMEQLSDLLLGVLYFVLPIGFGLTLLLHDRDEAYRAAMLDNQIKLLEKLWEQSPQA